MSRAQDEITLMSAQAATGIDKRMFVRDYRHIVLTVVGASSPNLTVKIAGGAGDDYPTPTSAQSDTNRWDYVQIKDLEDASTLDGDTGVVFAGTADVRQFEVNTNGLDWIIPHVTARSAGSVSIYGKPYVE